MNSSSADETEKLNEKAEKVEEPEDAAIIIQCEEIICTKRNGIIFVEHHQGKV